MVQQSSMGKVIVIESQNSYNFANELEQALAQTNGKIEAMLIESNNYRAVVVAQL